MTTSMFKTARQSILIPDIFAEYYSFDSKLFYALCLEFLKKNSIRYRVLAKYKIVPQKSKVS